MSFISFQGKVENYSFFADVFRNFLLCTHAWDRTSSFGDAQLPPKTLTSFVLLSINTSNRDEPSSLRSYVESGTGINPTVSSRTWLAENSFVVWSKKVLSPSLSKRLTSIEDTGNDPCKGYLMKRISSREDSKSFFPLI
jgi:hypothetical protein